MVPALLSAFVAATALAVGLILLTMPLLRRYALARPNARSSHRTPTPQGGGIAVIAAMLGAAFGVAAWVGIAVPVAVAVGLPLTLIALAAVGAWDDIRPLPPLPRLVLQVGCIAALLALTPAAGRLLPEGWPLGLEWALAVVAGLWFVNLVNFMDGLDWITVAEMVPIAALLAGFGAVGLIDPFAALAAAGLCGALVGFAVFNKPVARLFLGDVGSLPIGLAVAWLLYLLATGGHLAAALLLPLYYCADATLTLIRRLARRERIWQAHRSHFYQRATDNGFTALEVARQVFAMNLVLGLLACATVLAPALPVQLGALALGAVVVGWGLRRFARPRRRRAAT